MCGAVYMTKDKIKDRNEMIKLVTDWHKQGQRIIFTCGCFDMIHLGHIDHLEKARQLGDKLIVGLNSDRSVTELKGVQRPIIDAYARARLLAALQFVDIVILFDELTPMQLIEDIRPNILVKGGDYTIETIVGADFVLRYGGIVQIVYSIEGYSTTLLIESIHKRTEK